MRVVRRPKGFDGGCRRLLKAIVLLKGIVLLRDVGVAQRAWSKGLKKLERKPALEGRACADKAIVTGLNSLAPMPFSRTAQAKHVLEEQRVY